MNKSNLKTTSSKPAKVTVELEPGTEYLLKVSDQKKQEKLDIAFVIRPSQLGEYVPLAEIALTSYVKKAGFSAKIIDPNTWMNLRRTEFVTIQSDAFEDYFEFVKDEIVRLNPKFIGMGSYTSDYEFIIYFSNRIKKYTDAKVIIGGIQASILPEDFTYMNSPIDIVVQGEGENTLGDILKLKEITPENLKDIRGVCFYDEEKEEVVNTGRRPLETNLDRFPIPAYEDIDMELYAKPKKRVLGFAYYSVISVYTGRGCPFRCTFCSTHGVWGKSNVRHFSVDRIISEVELLVNTYNIDAIYLIDDTFTLNRERVLEFCKKLKPMGITWTAQTRVNCIDEELIVAMKESGCVQLTFGVETGSQKMLNATRKGTTVKQAEDVFALCKKHGVRTFANMMFNLPGETKEDVQESYKLYKKIKPDDFGLGLTVPYPGTPIYDEFFPRKLEKHEYKILGEAREFGKGEFRLCEHDLNLMELLIDFRMDMELQPVLPLFIRILADKRYRSMILKSKRRDDYIRAIVNDLPVGLIRAGGILVYNGVKNSPDAIKKPLLVLAKIFGKRFGN